MEVQKFYRHLLTALKEVYSDNEAAKITDMVFEWAVGISKSAILIDSGKQLNIVTIEQLNNALNELLLHVPVQYVMGHAWFYKMKLKVSPAVLIPRPETEELVLECLNYLGVNPHSSVLDIGTGSGCIALAIKKNIPQANVSAIDLSYEALEIAKENATSQSLLITFLQLNFLQQHSWSSLATYDIIVSNPPYIPLNEKDLLDENVRAHEPHTALFVPIENPLIFYENIALFAKSHLNKNGKIFMETHEDFAGRVASIFEESGYKPMIKKDMYGKERIVMATHCL